MKQKLTKKLGELIVEFRVIENNSDNPKVQEIFEDRAEKLNNLLTESVNTKLDENSKDYINALEIIEETKQDAIASKDNIEKLNATINMTENVIRTVSKILDALTINIGDK